MRTIFNSIIKNPMSLWCYSFVKGWYLKWKFKSLNLEFDYLSLADDCVFGMCNRLCEYAYLNNVSLGDFSYVGARSRLANTKVGKFVSIGPGVLSGLGRHPTKIFVSTHPVFYSVNFQSQIFVEKKSYYEEYRHVEIGNDVWIGANVVIVDGVKIGNGVIVGAGSVVNRDVPDYAIVSGVPFDIIRYRFSPAEIEFLLGFKWWDKDCDWLRDNYMKFHNIRDFMGIDC